MAAGVCFLILVGLAVLALGLIMNHYLPLFSKHSLLPRGTFGWPHPSNSVGHFLQDHCSRYGRVFKSHLFFSPTVVSCDQELNYFILQNEDKLFQCSYPKPIHGILGNKSMLVAVGDTHKRLRNVALSLVNTIKANPDFLDDIDTTAIQVLCSWKDKRQVIFCEEARKVLGLGPDDVQAREILKDFLTFMRGLISLPLYIPGTPYARAVKARSRISSTVRAIMQERRRVSVENSKKKNDFLDTLLRVDTLSEDEKVSFALDSLLGGYETTSLLMAMVVHFLGQSPSALQEMKEEHQEIRGMKQKDEYLNWEDFKKMNFTQNVVNEALRFGNIVKFVHRKALKDIKFKDYSIPCGWKVLPIFSAVHLDPSLHANALQFHPRRWETQDQACKKFTPFGGGSRCCPGSELAKVEVAFFLHHLVQNFRWSTNDGDHPIAYPYIEFHKGLVLDVESKLV
ncbi:hypothetical protein Nepgr_000693 [Nepenthes gracilis]|uniref:Cytochrome P450 724B1 n=1 Tax=Nepenthes gracilis TaxID=150966 RepID=A0AAD3P6V6_NEPGR|nr:hypothetical protein Nepgr_000693 [Nepenthes gracilis]